MAPRPDPAELRRQAAELLKAAQEAERTPPPERGKPRPMEPSRITIEDVAASDPRFAKWLAKRGR